MAIDEKGRVAVPARFRQQLSEDCGQQVYITRSYESCLEVYPAPVFKQIADQIQADTDRPRADLLTQVFIGNAVETEIDKQGRMLLPQLLRKFARLNGSAVLLGQIRRFDIWAEDLWNEKFGENAAAPKDLAAAFATLKR